MIFILLALLNSLITLPDTTIAESETFIKVTRFQVPSSVRAGDAARLSCAYELGGQSLHAMKLFKDDKEFFRYTPSAGTRDEQLMAFHVSGVNLDRARLSEREVWLRNVNRNSAGLYRCQVSVEETFNSISAERRMEVLNRTIGPGGGAGNSLDTGAGFGFVANSALSAAAAKNRQPQQRHTVQQQHQQLDRSAKGRQAYGLIPATPGASGQYQYQAASVSSSGAASSALCHSTTTTATTALAALIAALVALLRPADSGTFCAHL